MERSEITVTVGGEECTDRGSAGGDIVSSLCYSELYIISFASSLQYVCAPPDLPPGGNAEAQVVVRDVSLIANHSITLAKIC